MNTDTFCRSYIELAYQMLAVSQKPTEIEREYGRQKQESRRYVDYLGNFEKFFTIYPALKNELYTYLHERKTGAFIEYKLDLFEGELAKVEELRLAIQKEIDGLRSDFADESKEWLSEEEYAIEGCFRHLDTSNLQYIIDFLNIRLAELKTKKEFYLSEIRRMQHAAKAGERQAEEERIRRELEEAIRKGQKLSEQEKRERQIKAQEKYKEQMKRRKQ